MSVVIHKPPKHIDCTASAWDTTGSWIAHPDAHPKTETPEWKLVQERGHIEVFAEISDDCADYSYDDFALIRLRHKWYLLNTSGCSCPSPSETWNIQIGPTSLGEIKEFIMGGHYDGYTVPKKQMDEFLNAIKAAHK